MYYVVYNVDPYDCMGDRVKIQKFESLNSAIECYKNVFQKSDEDVNELRELFWDEESVAEAQEEGYNLIVSGEIILYQTDLILENIIGLTWNMNCQIEYGVWINDYDDLTFDNCCISLRDFFAEHGAKTLCSYPFEFIVTKDCSSECEVAIIECEKSLESIV